MFHIELLEGHYIIL